MLTLLIGLLVLLAVPIDAGKSQNSLSLFIELCIIHQTITSYSYIYSGHFKSVASRFQNLVDPAERIQCQLEPLKFDAVAVCSSGELRHGTCHFCTRYTCL